MAIPSDFFIANPGIPLRAVSLDSLPPELVHEIPAHLPNLHRPSVLLSLALTCRFLYDIIIPNLLYQAVWLEGEARAMGVLSGFNARLGQNSYHRISHHVRYLAIKSDINRATQDELPTNSFRGLRTLINAGGLPKLVSLSLHFGKRWFWDPSDLGIIRKCGELDHSFWGALRDKCPSLTHVRLTGVIQDSEELGANWITDSGLFDFTVSTVIE